MFETDSHLIVGDVTLPPEGYQSRFSDAVNRPDLTFVPLTDVELRPRGGEVVERREFIALSRAHVRFAYPVPAGSSVDEF